MSTICVKRLGLVSRFAVCRKVIASIQAVVLRRLSFNSQAAAKAKSTAKPKAKADPASWTMLNGTRSSEKRVGLQELC